MSALNGSNPAIFFSDSLYNIGRDAVIQTPFMNGIPVFSFSDIASLEDENMLNKFTMCYLVSDDGQIPGYFKKNKNGAYFKELGIKVDDFTSSGKPGELSNQVLIETIKCALLELKVQSSAEESNYLREKASLYAFAIESLCSVTFFQERSEVIDFMKEFFTMLCMPENLCYFKFDHMQDGDIHLIDFNLEDLRLLFESKSDHLISDSGNSYCFKIESGYEIDGILAIENVANPYRVNECINLALSIKKIFGLAIENVRHKNDIVKARNRLAESNELLKMVNKILRHDLANDFAAIKMSLEMYDLKPHTKYLELSKKAVSNGLERINDMRTLESLIDEGKGLKLYSVKDIVDSLASERLGLDVSVKGDCKVRADSAIASVFDNILKNAKTHGNARNIEISMEPVGSCCRISISDDGVGIPAEIKQRIFDEGFTSGSQGHSGLGLYIVKKTIERYGGKITVENNIPRGATFRIDLPSA